MLKIERVHKNQVVARFQKRNCFFNKSFVRAFFIAFSFHAFPLLFFTIGSFRGKESSIFLPIIALADLSKIDASIYVDLEGDRKVSRLSPFMNYSGQGVFPAPYFKIATRDKKEKKRRVFATLRSGIKTDFLSEALLPLLKDLKNVHAIYEIKVENRTGCIFWMEDKLGLEPNQDEAIREALKRVRFEKRETGFLDSGEIEIFL